MNEQTEALRLADALDRLRILDEVGSDNPLASDAAAELRRLHGTVESYSYDIDAKNLLIDQQHARIEALEAVMRQALEALTCTGEDDDPGHRCGHCDDYVDRNGPVRKALREALGDTQ